ncbi:Ldh family oxidoreductase, partial [Streptomyces albidoflavus]|nr:Ldh family oxidoreductase [Streptomyces albidoflavus]
MRPGRPGAGGRAVGAGPEARDAADLAHEAARKGKAVLLVTAADEPASAADRVVRLGTGPGPARRTAPDPRFTVEALTEAAVGSLTAAGVAPGRAALVARVLVDADVRGHFSHGIGLLPMYLDRLARGGIDAAAEPEWLSQDGPVHVLEAHGGFGQVAAERAAADCARR